MLEGWIKTLNITKSSEGFSYFLQILLWTPPVDVRVKPVARNKVSALERQPLRGYV